MAPGRQSVFYGFLNKDFLSLSELNYLLFSSEKFNLKFILVYMDFQLGPILFITGDLDLMRHGCPESAPETICCNFRQT